MFSGALTMFLCLQSFSVYLAHFHTHSSTCAPTVRQENERRTDKKNPPCVFLWIPSGRVCWREGVGAKTPRVEYVQLDSRSTLPHDSPPSTDVFTSYCAGKERQTQSNDSLRVRENIANPTRFPATVPRFHYSSPQNPPSMQVAMLLLEPDAAWCCQSLTPSDYVRWWFS